MLGLEILKAPWNLTKFVMELEPVTEDPWAEATF